MNQIDYIKNRINEYKGILSSIQKLSLNDELKEKEVSVKKEIETLEYKLAGINKIEELKENIRNVNINVVKVHSKVESDKNDLNNSISNIVKSGNNDIKKDILTFNSNIMNGLREVKSKIDNSKSETISLKEKIFGKKAFDSQKIDSLLREIVDIKKLLKEVDKSNEDNSKKNNGDKKRMNKKDSNDLEDRFDKLAKEVTELKETVEGFEGKLNRILSIMGKKGE